MFDNTPRNPIRSSRLRALLPVALGLLLLFGSLSAFGTADSPDSPPVTTDRALAAPDVATSVPLPPPAPPVATTAPPVPTTAAPPPAPALTWTMPDMVGQNLQLAQDSMQALTGNPVFVTFSVDASGLGRAQVLDANWRVCSQNVPAGTSFTADSMIEFAAVKNEEACP